MGFQDWLSNQASKVVGAGMEAIEAVGEGAVAGITDSIRDFGRGGHLSGANADAQVNNAPDIGQRGDGRGSVVSQPVPTLYQAPGFVQGMPTWAKWVGGGSVVLLTAGLGVMLIKGRG